MNMEIDMSERSYSVSMVASAVVLILGSFPSIADTLTESFEEKNSQLQEISHVISPRKKTTPCGDLL